MTTDNNTSIDLQLTPPIVTATILEHGCHGNQVEQNALVMFISPSIYGRLEFSAGNGGRKMNCG
jgi:hypothetical protein